MHATRLHAYIHARATEESIAASHFHEKSGDRDDVVAGGVATSRRLRGRPSSNCRSVTTAAGKGGRWCGGGGEESVN